MTDTSFSMSDQHWLCGCINYATGGRKVCDEHTKKEAIATALHRFEQATQQRVENEKPSDL